MNTVAIVGLGYVGLPLAVAFGKLMDTIGFDLNESKLECYRNGTDPSGEVDRDNLRAAHQLDFTNDPARLSEANIILVVVPTPIDHAHKPDLGPLEGACRTVAQHMRPGSIVVFESTVYPGCTEEFCVPILEKVSEYRWACSPKEKPDSLESVFNVGYSPERINPGDKDNRLENIVKVVSGDTADTLDIVANLYEQIINAGIFRAKSIKVAEAAKVIENTQRDLNIALMNELALIFHRLDIDTMDVLETAGTKWNFLPFRPGLVGGHCIGVDPYYLTYKAEAEGHHPQVILAGRQTNDSMGKFIAEQTVKCLVQNEKPVNGAQVVVLGLTFKEDCPDLRNSHVIDIINELSDYRCSVHVHDPLADPAEAVSEYGVKLEAWEDLPKADAVVLAVSHKRYKDLRPSDFKAIMAPGSILIDVKSNVDRIGLEASDIPVWRL